MTVLIHAVYALAYTVAGVSLGWALPYMRPESDPLVGWLTGAAVVLGGGLVHEAVNRRGREHALRRRLSRLAEAVEALSGDLGRQRAEVARLEAALAAARSAEGGVRYDAMMQEMKLLHSLVSRLHDRRTAAAQPLVPVQAPPVVAAAAAPPEASGPDGAALDDASVLEAVRDALKADRIDIHLQPVVSLPQRKHRFYEVYSRVRARDGSQILPDRYIAIAEREGLIATIDNLLLMRCIQLIRETERRGHPVAFFCNIAPASLGDGEFMRQFLHCMAQNQTLVPKLVFELGQDDPGTGEGATLAILAQLARTGFRFSMDQVRDLDAIDVDALARRDFRYLKLDRARLLDPAVRPRVRALLRACKEHDIDVIVEKIETEAQLVELLDLGIDYGQGYLFGEPRPARKPG
ncbi:EAL domain-containing protein [Azospirillum halopraeferens]|uniref:EAL domain-containing protein n=1 Tax=Azospirillum halopraeferens TaxID=34010 RepID=UPI0004239B06|nr:EAL domain-containing protein [Azospirillum halopraeferens]